MDRLHLPLTANERCERDREGMRDKLGCVTCRGIRKDDGVVLHLSSLSSHVQAMVSTACCRAEQRNEQKRTTRWIEATGAKKSLTVLPSFLAAPV